MQLSQPRSYINQGIYKILSYFHHLNQRFGKIVDFHIHQGHYVQNSNQGP